MRLEHTPRTEQTLRVSARLITSSTILHLSSDELERTITQEQTENPALEVIEKRVCLFCSSQLYGTVCVVCGRPASGIQPSSYLSDSNNRYETATGDMGDIHTQQAFYDIDNYGFAVVDSDDASDPLARISSGKTLQDELFQQLEAIISPEDACIAEQLVGNLNERGYLEISVNDIADLLALPAKRVEYVLSQLQTLEPLGIGARDLRECLLIQLNALNEQSFPHPLAYTIIDRYLDQLGHNQFTEIARQLKVAEQEVRQASHYIRSTLHPFPAHIYQPIDNLIDAGNVTTYIRPDVIIRKGEMGFEVRLMEEERYEIRVETTYSPQEGLNTTATANVDLQRYMYQLRDRAKFFQDCIRRRWRTLKQVAELVVEMQTEFLEKGIRYLHPLTRAQIASHLQLDEGTVSRATANKYALLPNGRLIPIADFFDGSLSIKDQIREIIQAEDPRHHLSDEEIARIITARGTSLARRTVTKYREEMGIGSSRERR